MFTKRFHLFAIIYLLFTILSMTLDALIMLIGTFVALLPFLGFPIRWDNIILVVLGITIVILGIAVRRRGKRRSPTGSSGVFVENSKHE